MKSTIGRFLFPAVSLASAGLLSTGCVYDRVSTPAGMPAQQISVRDPGYVAGTGIESQDLVNVTDKMARELLQLPQFNNFAGTPPCIAMLPIENQTSFPINKDIFLTRIQDALFEKGAGRMRFLARDRMPELQRELDLKRSGQVTSSTDPNLVAMKGVDFFLTGKLSSMTTQTSAGRSDYVLYSFQLIEPSTSVIVWQGSAEIKKQGQEDATYR
jgi:hypothetical protein